MSDIITRLQTEQVIARNRGDAECESVCGDAEDEIGQLRSDVDEYDEEISDLKGEITRLRKALREIATEDEQLNSPDAEYDLDDVFLRVVGIAKEALGDE